MIHYWGKCLIKGFFLFIGVIHGWCIYIDHAQISVLGKRKSEMNESLRYAMGQFWQFTHYGVIIANATPASLHHTGFPIQKNVRVLSLSCPCPSSLVSWSAAMSTEYLASSLAIKAVLLSGWLSPSRSVRTFHDATLNFIFLHLLFLTTVLETCWLWNANQVRCRASFFYPTFYRGFPRLWQAVCSLNRAAWTLEHLP